MKLNKSSKYALKKVIDLNVKSGVEAILWIGLSVAVIRFVFRIDLRAESVYLALLLHFVITFGLNFIKEIRRLEKGE